VREEFVRRERARPIFTARVAGGDRVACVVVGPDVEVGVDVGHGVPGVYELATQTRASGTNSNKNTRIAQFGGADIPVCRKIRSDSDGGPIQHTTQIRLFVSRHHTWMKRNETKRLL